MYTLVHIIIVISKSGERELMFASGYVTVCDGYSEIIIIGLCGRLAALCMYSSMYWGRR